MPKSQKLIVNVTVVSNAMMVEIWIVDLAKMTMTDIDEGVVDRLNLTTTTEDIDDAEEGDEIEMTTVMTEVVSLLTTIVAVVGAIGLFHLHKIDIETDEGTVLGLDQGHDRLVTEEREDRIVVPMEIVMATSL